MKRITSVLIAPLLVIWISACSNAPQIHKYTYFAFGTVIELTISGVDKKLADKAADTVRADFEKMHNDWHSWRPGPLLGLNRNIANSLPAPVNADLLPLLVKAQQLAANSNDTFNPGLGKLLSLWGYQSDEQPVKPPATEEIEVFLKSAPSMTDYSIEDGKLISKNPALQFDLGGFAKGYGIELAIKRLQSMGIENAILNAGGDLKVIGKRHDRHWRVGIRHPRKAGVIAWLDVDPGESVFTSGDYERFFFYHDKRYHHILDPRTGYPATETISVSIVNDDATLADAAATALFVAGPEDWQKVAEKMGIDKVMLIDSLGQIHFTPALKKRIQLTEQQVELVDEAKSQP